MRLSIVIPACNEEQRIGPMLDAYLPFFAERYGDDVEFIVVINGSTDATEDVVSGYKARCQKLRTIVDPGRIGKGGALIRGFSSAEGDCVGFVDADGSTPPEAFHELVEKVGEDGVDAAIASRWIEGAEVHPVQAAHRQLSSRAFNLCVRILFGLSYHDTQCGAKVVSKEALHVCLPELSVHGWACDVDLLYTLKRHGRNVAEVPTRWSDVSGSKLHPIIASFEMFMSLLQLQMRSVCVG
jgi:glycosyltransferase involved in cell wall biosynthesis